jgi:outer membrane protein TolC
LVDEQLEQNRLLQEDLERNYQRISGYAANGMANQADLDAVRVEQLKAIQQRTHAEATRKAYMEMLGVMTDLPLNQSTQLVKPDVEELSLTAEVKRPELQLFEAQENLFDVQRLKIKSAYMPKLNLFVQGGYGNPGLNMLENKFSTYYLGGVRLSWNFGALYTQKNDVRKLGLNKQDVSAQRETFLYNLAMETRQENTAIGKLKQLMTYDNEIITLRENVRKSAEAKVANGTLTVIELMREINAENLARQEKAAHEIELLLSLSNLKTTMNN